MHIRREMHMHEQRTHFIRILPSQTRRFPVYTWARRRGLLGNIGAIGHENMHIHSLICLSFIFWKAESNLLQPITWYLHVIWIRNERVFFADTTSHASSLGNGNKKQTKMDGISNIYWNWGQVITIYIEVTD